MKLKKFIEKEQIDRIDYFDDLLILNLYKNDELVEVFHIGKKYKDSSKTELINDGNVLFKGFQNMNWVFIPNEKYFTSLGVL